MADFGERGARGGADGTGAGGGAVQRSPGKRSMVEARYGVQRRERQPAAQDDAQVHAAAEQGLAQPAGALPHADRIQAAFGHHDVSGIAAHVGGAATAASDAMGAEAYATGNHVAFRAAPDLHTAAHEAAHVVQQRSGVALKGGVGEAGDPYEQHADAVADAVVAGRSAAGLLDQMSGGGGGGEAVQRRAIKAEELQGTEDDGNGPIFDSRISAGKKFKVKLEVEGADWPKVLATYQTAIRPIGNAVSGEAYTDKKLTFQNNLAKKEKWGQTKQTFSDAARTALKMPDTVTLETQPTWEYWKGLADMAKAPDTLRANDDVGLIDPFVIDVAVKDSAHEDKPAWQIVTQFADSGTGYIKKIYNGAQDLGGSITTAAKFDEKKGEDANDKSADYLYSSTHEQGSSSFGSRMDAISTDKDKKGDNAKGLDAVTWLAAEGARFAPMAKLGTVGSPESRFFIKPNNDDWTGYKFVTATDLMRMWLTDFEKKYDVSTQKLAQVVGAKGKTTEDKPPAGWHYNLTGDARHEQT